MGESVTVKESYEEFTEQERRYLIDVLIERLGTQRQGVYHSDNTEFKKAMKEEEGMIRQLIYRLESGTFFSLKEESGSEKKNC